MTATEEIDRLLAGLAEQPFRARFHLWARDHVICRWIEREMAAPS
jgi:hypothetical protein